MTWNSHSRPNTIIGFEYCFIASPAFYSFLLELLVSFLLLPLERYPRRYSFLEFVKECGGCSTQSY